MLRVIGQTDNSLFATKEKEIIRLNEIAEVCENTMCHDAFLLVLAHWCDSSPYDYSALLIGSDHSRP